MAVVIKLHSCTERTILPMSPMNTVRPSDGRPLVGTNAICFRCVVIHSNPVLIPFCGPFLATSVHVGIVWHRQRCQELYPCLQACDGLDFVAAHAPRLRMHLTNATSFSLCDQSSLSLRSRRSAVLYLVKCRDDVGETGIIRALESVDVGKLGNGFPCFATLHQYFQLQGTTAMPLVAVTMQWLAAHQCPKVQCADARCF